MVSAIIDHRQTRHERINKLCDTCGTRIYFIRNPRGKMIPFDMGTRRCHFETCLTPPSTNTQPYEKPKITYRTVKNNTNLKEFMIIV